MKALYLLAIAITLLPLLHSPVHAEEDGETNIDVSTGIKSYFDQRVGAQIKTANDELDHTPTLTITIPEGDFERYFGSVRLPIPNPTPGDYTVIFEARLEPTENVIELRVYDFSTKQPVEVGPRKPITVQPDWKEFVYNFTIQREGVVPTVTWTEMARSGKTFSLRNVRLVKY